MKVEEIMNKAFVIDHDDSIKAAAKIMASKDIGSLVVIKGEELIGIITERDIIKNITQLDKKIYAIMNKQIITINAEEGLDNAVILMNKYKIKKLPVVDKKRKLVGIITATDLINHSEELEEDFILD